MLPRCCLSTITILIALTTLSCTSNRTVDRPVVGGTGLSIASDEGPLVDYSEGDFFFDEEQDSDESDSPPFALSEGQPDWDGGQARPPLAETTPLSQEQVQELLTRLPPVHEGEGDVERVRLPDQSLPPPRPGEEVQLTFPPPESEYAPISKQTSLWQRCAFTARECAACPTIECYLQPSHGSPHEPPGARRGRHSGRAFACRARATGVGLVQRRSCLRPTRTVSPGCRWQPYTRPGFLPEPSPLTARNWQNLSVGLSAHRRQLWNQHIQPAARSDCSRSFLPPSISASIPPQFSTIRM